ncbi:MAG: DUF4169 family protein [Alphaproteobacteria bacterium]|jgi:hypothetical protein|nr:MAG: DUF4169 family protein [Alphaproteobacteria bacterium]
MADILNLNKARKARAKAQSAAKAVENRAKFGRTKAQKAADDAERARISENLDGARRE